MIGYMIFSVQALGMEEEPRYLRIPVYYNELEGTYLAKVTTPDSRQDIVARSKTLEELSERFNEEFRLMVTGDVDIANEIYDMFMPEFYFDSDPLEGCESVGDPCILKKTKKKR